MVLLAASVRFIVYVFFEKDATLMTMQVDKVLVCCENMKLVKLENNACETTFRYLRYLFIMSFLKIMTIYH